MLQICLSAPLGITIMLYHMLCTLIPQLFQVEMETFGPNKLYKIAYFPKNLIKKGWYIPAEQIAITRTLFEPEKCNLYQNMSTFQENLIKIVKMPYWAYFL